MCVNFLNTRFHGVQVLARSALDILTTFCAKPARGAVTALQCILKSNELFDAQPIPFLEILGECESLTQKEDVRRRVVLYAKRSY